MVLGLGNRVVAVRTIKYYVRIAGLTGFVGKQVHYYGWSAAVTSTHVIVVIVSSWRAVDGTPLAARSIRGR